ncbi:PREDICTED: putative E3 ubiquitin-protein ligase UNKL [Bison bison bison]|uniref:E3 ubiquitin-protein ligase UNKL n=1 Tax=Bison bison bison TaxID=43346 RepID=A0A6P3H6R4_BISBB|nr:PREDICTED: putative E3 ubiquitin-protein ligase UNKL [Bison bison bison]
MEKILGEDPRWQDTNFVLGSYKTEQCPKPPRLCRQGYACPHFHNSRDRRRDPRRFQYRSTPCPSVKHGDEWGEPSRCASGDSCALCHSRTEQQFHPEIYKSTKCNDMRQTGHCPRGPFCAFAHVDKSLGMASDWSCRDLALTNVPTTPSGQPGHAKRRESPADGSQKASEQDGKQSHLAVLAVGHPLAPSVSSSLASSLASSTGSGGSSPTALPALSARTHPLDPSGSAGEGVPGSTLDLHLGDISLVPPDKDLEEHDGRDLGPTGQRSLGGSAPVAIPGCLPRSPSLHSSSSLSASPLGSFSQSLPGPLISSAMTPPQQPPPLKSEPRALGPSVSSYNSFGLNGVPGSIWDFVSGSFSPSPSPILNAGPAASSGVSPSSAELARVRRQLDEAKRKIRQPRSSAYALESRGWRVPPLWTQPACEAAGQQGGPWMLPSPKLTVGFLAGASPTRVGDTVARSVVQVLWSRDHKVVEDLATVRAVQGQGAAGLLGTGVVARPKNHRGGAPGLPPSGRVALAF